MLYTGPSEVQRLRVTAISSTSVVISWSEPPEARDGYEVELRQYIEMEVGTAEAVSLHKFALGAQERNIFIDSLGK